MKFKTLVLAIMLMSLSVLLLAFEVKYQTPGGKIEELFNRPYHPSVSIYKQQNKKMIKERTLYMPLDFLAEPVVHLAGIDIYEKNRSGIRSTFFTKFSIADLYSDSSLTVPLPENAVYGSDIPSYDGKKALIQEYSKDSIKLWLVHVDSVYSDSTGQKNPQVTLLLNSGINQSLDDYIQWMPDNSHVLINMVVEQASKPNTENNIPQGPVVFESSGKESQNRTFPNLLKNQTDEDLFEYYAQSQLCLLDINDGSIRKVFDPMILYNISISPDGRFLLAKEILKPYSRKVNYYYFPSQWIVLDLEKQSKTILNRTPVIDDLKAGWVQKGIRYYWWNSNSEHNIFQLVTLDDGSPENNNSFKDEVLEIEYPYVIGEQAKLQFLYEESNPQLKSKSIYKSKNNRISMVNYINDDVMLVRESNWKNKWRKSFLANIKNYKQYIISDRSSEERYDLPGDIVFQTDLRGNSIPVIQDTCIFFIGNGLSSDSRKPFIDQLNLNNFEKKRLYEFDETDYVSIISIHDEKDLSLLISKENPDTPSNLYTYSIRDSLLQAITHNTDTIPELTQLQKRVIKYQRADGVQLSGLLYLPSDYQPGNRLPLIMSAYPQEYSDPETASQSTKSDKRYSRPWSSSPLYFCLEGFAVLEDASFPIIGDPQTVNDTWMTQAIANAHAAIQYLSQEGIVDSEQVIIQGHSYGAFMVLNLLAHSDLFAGGIARNGAYNRTLTPFGFQKERRNLWEAKSVYLELSPFLFADQIKKPLLLIHSMEDTNPGTFPIQSQRLFEALEGLGKDCRFVQLPLEDHSYSAKETHLHLLWEYREFFKKVLKK